MSGDSHERDHDHPRREILGNRNRRGFPSRMQVSYEAGSTESMLSPCQESEYYTDHSTC